MDEARAVLARLDRIETLEREGAPPAPSSTSCAGSSTTRRHGHGEKEVSERGMQSNVAQRL
jgi:hypothetical protein